MKLSFLMAAFAIIITNSLQAQTRKPHTKTAAKAEVNYKVSWGPDLKLKGSFPEKILLYDQTGFYAVTEKHSDDYLSKFNNRMELLVQAKVETEKSDKRMKDHTIESVLEFNNAIYAITRERDKDNKTIVYFAEKVDLSSLIPDGNKIKIYEADYSVDKKREDVDLRFILDKDKKVMILYDQHAAVKEEDVKVSIHSLDATFKVLWKKDVELPLISDSKRNYSFDKYVDPNANVYLLAKVYDDDPNGKKKNKYKDVKEGQLNYDYHIYTIGNGIETYIDYPFELKDKAVSEINLDINNKGELVACGFYGDINADKNKVSGAKGVFYTIIDPANKEIKAQSYKKFENEVFTAGLSEKKKGKLEEKMEEGKREGDASSYIIRDLVQRKDGGSTMFAEEHYIYTVTYYDGKYTHTTTHYVYKNIIVTKINAAGEIEWTTVIPKYADVTQYNLICSYIKFDEGNDTYDLFFNDHRDNLIAISLEKNGAEPINGKLKPMRFVRIVVNADGSLSKREEAFQRNEDDEDTRLCPGVSKVVSDNEIVLYGVDRRKEKFAKITFDNLGSIR
jgi:hypothetical protein